MKGEINSNTIVVGDFNIPLTPMDRSTKPTDTPLTPMDRKLARKHKI